MATNTRTKKGFTLVELMLAMSMLSILLLAIAMLAMQIIKIYDKGISLKATDTTGRMVSADIKRAVNESDSQDVHFVQFRDGATTVSARLCTTKVSYAWNYPTAFASPTPSNVEKVDGTPVQGMVKVAKNDICTQSSHGPGDAEKLAKYPNLTKNETTELLSSGDRDLGVYGFAAPERSAISDGQEIIAFSITLGTKDSTAIATDGSCKTDAEGGNDTFCAINTFNFTARAGSKL